MLQKSTCREEPLKEGKFYVRGKLSENSRHLGLLKETREAPMGIVPTLPLQQREEEENGTHMLWANGKENFTLR